MRALFVSGALLLAAPLALWAAPPDLPASPFSGAPADPAPPAPTLEDIRRELLGIDADLAEAVRTQDLAAIPRLSAAHDRLAGIEAGLLDLRRAAAANAEDDREGPQVYWYADGATHFFYSPPD